MAQESALHDAIVNGDDKKARAATAEALAAGVAPMDLIQESMVPAMDEVGRLFEAEEYFVPELLLAGRAMKSSMELLKPLLSAAGQKMAVRVVIGTVKGDLHDIGKNIVASMLEGAGF
jgi:methanogenic corrinoid protein MtbC1